MSDTQTDLHACESDPARPCTRRGCGAAPARLLIVPGLNDSGPGHWQNWLQAREAGSVRVVQHDWSRGDLERWSARVANTLERAGPGPWIAVAHSFGVLALVHHLAHRNDGQQISAALLVAPAEPDRFGTAGILPAQRLSIPTTVVISTNDPWMTVPSAQRWARRWGSDWLNVGEAGHINVASGHVPWPLAQRWVTATRQRLARERRTLQEVNALLPAGVVARAGGTGAERFAPSSR